MEETKLQLEAGKSYRCRQGKKVYIFGPSPFKNDASRYAFYGVTEGDPDPTAWRADGTYLGQDTRDRRDLVAEWVEPKRIKGWVNFYYREAEGRFLIGRTLYDSRERATEMGKMDAVPYTACVEIDVLEGHGLEGGR
jgi:hypothetical protein